MAIDETNSPHRQPVAIVGMACRLPGAPNVEALNRLVWSGADAVGPIPDGRRRDILGPGLGTADNLARFASLEGGFLGAVDGFDAEFFNTTPREAACVDPQQRLLMEVAWEALEDAGMPAETFEGAQAGIFVGQWTSDYEARMFQASPDTTLYATTGGGRYATGARVSYALNLQGPCMTLDTACSSSLVAVHLGRQALLAGECDLALAGGVNLILQPQITIAYSRAKILSRSGRCRFADAAADGYVRSEGCAVVVLKTLRRALADGDRIHALLIGSAVNNDGRQGLFVAPSPQGQEALLRQACASAAIAPEDFDYFEAHGTGTVIGDPVELQGLGEVAGKNRPPERPLLVGSIKTNIGHTEAAAGLAGLLKAVQVLKTRSAPPNVHLSSLNPKIAWDPWRLKPVRQTEALESRQGRPLLAGVNSFGVTGTNAQVVLQEVTAAPIIRESPDPAEYLVPLSAKSPEALQGIGELWKQEEGFAGSAGIIDVAYTAALRRTHFAHRAAVVCSSSQSLAANLADESRWVAARAGFDPAAATNPVWIFSGQGPQWWGMGQELLDSEVAFRQAIEAIDRLFQPMAGWPLLEEMRKGERDSRIGDTEVAQPLLFALQVGLAALWRHWGIEPRAVAGHSVGEIAAASVAGALPLEEAVRIVYHRGRLLQKATGKGRMAAAELTADEARALVEESQGQLWIAAWNSPRSVTLSGDSTALEAIGARLEAENRFFRFLQVNYAFHSGYVAPHAEELGRVLKEVKAQAPQIPLISTVTGEPMQGAALNAGYWVRNAREPVQFAQAVAALVGEEEMPQILEIGPHPVLNTAIAQTLEDRRSVILGSLRRGMDERRSMLQSLGDLYAHGAHINWSAVAPKDGRVVSLPHYPWQRKRHWFEEPETVASPRASGLVRELVWEPVDNAVIPQESAEILVTGSEDCIQAVLEDMHCKGSNINYVEIDSAEDKASAPAVLRDAMLGLVQRLKVLQTAAPPRPIHILTQGAIAHDGQPPDPVQTALRSFAGAIMAEHPDRIASVIDVGRSAPPASAHAPGTAARGCALALRGGKVQTPRLKVLPDTLSQDKPALAGVWLLSGGFGDLGLAMARYLSERGVKRLVLCGRRGIHADDPRASEKREALAQLEKRGAEVIQAKVDITDRAALEKLCGELRVQGWWPLAGAMHLAAVTRDQLALDVDSQSLDAVLRPKMLGALNLGRLAESMPEMQLVFFSSIASLIPQPGQAAYAAANGYLDGLAQSLKARGLRALAVNWGPWAQAGLARSGGGAFATEAFANIGVSALNGEQAAAALDQILAADLAQAAVFPVRRDAQALHPMLMDEAVRQSPAKPSAGPSAALEAVRAESSGPDRRRRLELILREAVAKVTGQEPEAIDIQRSFGAMGFDSLMAFELKNRIERLFGLALPATVAWNYPTVGQLAEHLGAKAGLLSGEPKPTTPTNAPQQPAALAAADLSQVRQTLGDVDRLSEEEALQSLLKNSGS